MSGNIIAVKRKVLPIHDKDEDSKSQPQPYLQTYNQLKKETKSTQTEELSVTVKESVACIDYDLITSRIIAGLEGKIALLITNLSRINVYSSVTDLLETSSDIEEEPGVAVDQAEPVQIISDETEPVQIISDEAVQVNITEDEAEAVQVISNEAEPVQVNAAEADNMSEPPVQVNTAEASSTNVAPKSKLMSQGELYNEYFQATMILDITGTGTGLSEAHNQHIQNCFLLSPELPDNCTPSKRILYYMHSAIELAKEHNYERVNIITNHLRIYKNFMDVMSIAIPLLNKKEWNLVHYCCNNVSYPYQAVDLDKFDSATYCTLNNDLPDIVKVSKARSIQDWCARGHKIGRFANVSLLESTSSNTLAFGISSSEYDNLLLTLEREIELPHSDGQHIFDNVTNKFMLAPNLFMVPGTGASIMKQLRWLPQLYLEV
jgi:hypothetical protein